MTDFVVEGEFAQEQATTGFLVLIEGGGLDVLAGSQIELRADGTGIFDSDPVNNPLVGCAFALGG